MMDSSLQNRTSSTDNFTNTSTNATVQTLMSDILVKVTQVLDLPTQNESLKDDISRISSDVHSDLEERLRSILKEQNISVFQYFSKLSGLPSHTLPTTTTARIPYTSGVVSWGFITPLTLIGIFLMFVAICLCYQNWKEKQRLRSYIPAGPVPVFSSEISGSVKHEAGSRDSIRSNTSARSIGSNTFDKPQLISLPRKIQDNWMASVPTRILSPIDENDTSNSKNTIVEVKSHSERINSYQMSWLNEAAKEIGEPSKLGPNDVHIVENPLPNQLGNDQFYGAKPTTRQMDYPHYNTPTNEFDGASECSDNLCGGDSALSTNIHDNMSLPSTIYPALGRAPLSVTDGADLSSVNTYFDHQRPPSRQIEDFNAPSEHTSAVTSFTESASGTLSLPSSISRFHASRLNNTPNSVYPLASTHNSQAKLNFTAASSIDLSENNSQYSDNTSMFPNVGSSITSFGPSVVRSNPNSSCPSDISPEYYNGNARPETGPSTRQNSFSTDSGESHQHQINDNNHVSLAKEAELFRNWSFSAGINSGSLGNLPNLAPTHLSSGESYSLNQTKDDSAQSKSDGHITMNSYDFNHNLSPPDNRKVKFSVPVLNKKQYWV